MSTISIIGSGFSSLSAACYLAKQGFEVNLYEKNSVFGGRARVLEKEGFRFDMGPSWYWMPDVFERYFSDFGKQPSDYYELIKLSPGYKVFFEDSSHLEIPSNIEEVYQLFEKEETGGASKLKSFLQEALYNYEVGVQDLVYKPGLSPIELITPQTIKKVYQFFTSIRAVVRKRFKSKKLVTILEFPVLFLGAKPEDTPAFYSFMNYADLVLGTWYPKGGMYNVVKAMTKLGSEIGVNYFNSSNVEKILTEGDRAVGICVNGKDIYSDFVLSGADYQHSEQLLSSGLRGYSEKYWEQRVFAPSALLFYIGFSKKLKNLRHHTLFFDEDFDSHAKEIYDQPSWPKNPLFYASFPSITDSSIAPAGKEAAVLLIPLSPGIEDDLGIRKKYLEMMLDRLELHTKQSLKADMLFYDSYCINDFKNDYNSYKGNAYGMANTLRQTAFMRPKLKSNKVKHLYFTGQLTVPGPGVPPALISGKVVSDLIIKEDLKNQKNGYIVQ